jgi:glycosyltransferase involved in cell wall biosynthesis
MRIAIIADTAEGCAGIDRYARELTTRLIESHAIEEVVLVHSDNWSPRARPRLDGVRSEKVKELILPLPKAPFQKELRQMFVAPFVLGKLRDEGIDIVHDLHQFAPFLLSFGSYARVATVHDVTPFVTRWLHPWSRRVSFYIRYKCVLPLVLRRANAIIAVSANTKRDLEQYVGVHPDKIRVVYHGISEDYHPIKEPELLNKVRHDYNLNSPFVLAQATSARVDNAEILLEAFRVLRADMSKANAKLQAPKLVFFGYHSPDLACMVKNIGLQDDVSFLGFVPESVLPSVYSMAELFVYPSLYDGFGFPPLEAMACGTPTIVSDVASLPEVVGDGALKFNPYDAMGLANAMHGVLTEDDVRRSLSQGGLHRAKEFNWTRTASETLKVYSELLDVKSKK